MGALSKFQPSLITAMSRTTSSFVLVLVVAISARLTLGQKASFLTQDNIARHCVGESYQMRRVDPATGYCNTQEDGRVGEGRRKCVLKWLKWNRRSRVMNDIGDMEIGNAIDAADCFGGKSRLNDSEMLAAAKCVARKFAVACNDKVNRLLAMKSAGGNGLRAWRLGWRNTDVVPDRLERIPEYAAYVSFSSGTDVLPGKLISTADVCGYYLLLNVFMRMFMRISVR